MLADDQVAYCDSDFLFFRPYVGLFTRPASLPKAVFMTDVGHAYAVRPWRLWPVGRIKLVGWLNAGLTVARGADKGFGLTGSSIFVINPPHGLAETLREVLPFLAQALAQFEGATHRLDVHAK